MTTIELARKMAEYRRPEEAQKAYTLVLGQDKKTPAEEMEAASYIFFSQGKYQTAYTTFVSLYNRGYFQAEIMNLITQAFYLPNLDEQKDRYRANCQALSKYPYCFRTDFLPFENLPIRFFPYDDQGYIPFFLSKNHFDNYVNFNYPVIDRHFFKSLEKPILAQDVFSQYQLEYLHDNVRKSEWVAQENHIYLHYTNWEIFCAYLQCLDFESLLQDEKIVFLIEDEISQYPIDFKARFGIDYSQYPIRPINVQEVTRLIWHTQLSAHNGGDFFNEIFYGHPNLLSFESVMFDNISSYITEMKEHFRKHTLDNMAIHQQLAKLKHPTDKDFLVAFFLSRSDMSGWLDKKSRIAPALFFQPHFHNIIYEFKVSDQDKYCQLYSDEYEAIQKASIFKGFKYLKTFTPMRRPTTSYAATIRFMVQQVEKHAKNANYIADVIAQRLVNRSFMVDPQDHLFQDSILVRFEDGKLNPTATFSALAEFLDIPYTESMTYCSSRQGLNPESLAGNARGFDPVTVYRTYDEYADEADRALLEYFLRDVYEMYGYNFHYYHNEDVNEAWIMEKIESTKKLDNYIANALKQSLLRELSKDSDLNGNIDSLAFAKGEEMVNRYHKNRRRIAKLLLNHPYFINRDGQPLHFMKKLELDPALLEQPLYH